MRARRGSEKDGIGIGRHLANVLIVTGPHAGVLLHVFATVQRMSDIPPVFTVIDSGSSIDDGGAELPTVVINAIGHPEIEDLARVHAVEGIGDVATEAAMVPVNAEAQAAGVDRLLVLMIGITVPVRCNFAVAVALPEHREELDHAIRAGRLVIATTPPDRAGIDRPLWLSIDLEPERLSTLLEH